MAEEQNGRWVTLDNGTHLFIKKGQTLDDAIEKLGKGEAEKKRTPQNKTLKKNKPQIYKDYENAKGAVEDYDIALSVAKNNLKKNPNNLWMKARVEELRKLRDHYQSIVDEHEKNKK